VGAFIRRAGAHWTTGLCSLVAPSDLVAATEGFPRALGRGRVALLAGGSFAGARVMALDRAGRILGYGFGPGSADELSICPGARRSVELVRRHASRVAVRDLRTLRVIRTLPAPPYATELSCLDRRARRIVAAGVRYTRSHRLGLVRVAWLRRAGPGTIAAVSGDTVAVDRHSAYAADGTAIKAVRLASGRVRVVAPYSDAGVIAPSPDGSRLAVSAVRHRTSVLALPGGAFLGQVSAGSPAWLPDGRLLVSGSAGARLFGPGLGLQRRLPPLRGFPAAVAGTVAYGVSRRRLSALDIQTGRRRLVTTLPDPDTVALTAVPGARRIDAPRTAPSPAAAATAACSRRAQPS
jgi:hypothetical protein